MNDGMLIVLLPHGNSGLDSEDPHCTLVTAGKVGDAHPSIPMGLARTAELMAMSTQPFMAMVMGSELFGERNEPVLLVEAPELVTMRAMVEQFDQSSWASFRPHIAVRAIPYPDMLPQTILFNRIAAWVGEDRHTYRLGSGSKVSG